MPAPRDAREAVEEPALASLLDDDAEDLYQNAPCGYLSTLPDGTIVKVNRTFLTWTGYQAADLVGRVRFQELLTAGGRIYHETHVAPLLRMQGWVREIAVEIAGAGDRRLPALINSVVKADASGTPVLVRSTVFDARDRREYERELLRARQRAEESEARARALARTLQQSLIPPALPQVPGLQVGAAFRPAGTGEEVGGDFYDVFEVGGGDWGVVIGDVRGKGVEAARITALARYTIRAAAMRAATPGEVLRTLNEALLREGTDRFCTVAYVRVRRPGSGPARLTISSAGHPLPLRASAAGVVSTAGRPGTVLGVVAEPRVPDTAIELHPGESLVLYTDGVTEGRVEGDVFGDERLHRLVASHAELHADGLAGRVVDEVVAFQDGRPRDDVAVVVLKVPGS